MKKPTRPHTGSTDQTVIGISRQKRGSPSGAVLPISGSVLMVEWLCRAEVLGIDAMASRLTLSRFLALFDQSASDKLNSLHRWAPGRLPSSRDGYTLDLDSWSFLLQRSVSRAGAKVDQGAVGRVAQTQRDPGKGACRGDHLPNLIADYLTGNGAMRPERLYESPFTDLNP